jgi:hypothetical protein
MTEEQKKEQEKHIKDPDFLFMPVHEESWSYLITSIPKRFVGLISKLISVKMFMFYVATALFVLFPEYFSDWIWLMVMIIVVFGRDAGKIIKEIKR